MYYQEVIMSKLAIAEDKQHFIRDGQPFFWVGDTLWSAFTNPTLEEWAEYLKKRKSQGFNVIQINTLPQWDRILPDQGIYPYPMDEKGAMDYTAELNMEYVDRSRKICRMAVDEGFTLALVVVWGNLVPGTWMGNFLPQSWPLSYVEQHVRNVVRFYDEFDPVYIVSGDTDLISDAVIEYYQRTIDILKEEAPDSLRTMHLCGGFTGLTQELADGLDFLVYQSGHEPKTANRVEELTAEMKTKFPGKPVLNAEPCYELMGKMTGDFTKGPSEVWSMEEVLDACERSIRSGANAGITYGANGLWNWNRNEDPSKAEISPFYGNVAFWRDALNAPGADHIAELEKYSGI